MAKRRKQRKVSKRQVMRELAIGLIILVSVIILAISAFSDIIDLVIIVGLIILAIIIATIFAGKGSLD
ncbi:MAG: hypothetical protein ACE5NL_01400 [Candidatus Hydrothermarchaeaceae archaeon]